MPKKKTKEEFLKEYSGKQNPIPNIFSKKKQKQGASQGKPFKKKKKKKGKYGGDIPARKEVPGNPHGVTKKDQEGNIILMAKDGGSASKFPDLSGDGKVTQKDILMGRGVIKRKRGGDVHPPKKNKSLKQLKTISKSVGVPGATAGLASEIGKLAKKLAGRLATRGYGKARK